MSTNNAAGTLARELCAGWLDAVERAEGKGFVELSGLEEACALARADSCFWCEDLLAEGARPHDPARRVQHAIHLATADTPDLLRHTYKAKGYDLVVIESRNFALVRTGASVAGLPTAGRRRAIHRAAAALLAHKGRAFQLPKDLEEGASFSTNPDASPWHLASFRDRHDGGIRRGEIYFLAYKKISSRVGFADARAWFSDAFRLRHGAGSGKVEGGGS